jgi:hypothetical protein|tara:strand:- start:495 stop:911 length:417 start_codon:yes stop_codon:yes gene_type:complete
MTVGSSSQAKFMTLPSGLPITRVVQESLECTPARMLRQNSVITTVPELLHIWPISASATSSHLAVTGSTSFGSDIDFASRYISYILGFIGINAVKFIAADKYFKDDQALTRADDAVDEFSVMKNIKTDLRLNLTSLWC